MKCPRCQQESPADADFCPECGAKLAVVCAACGTANAPTHKFCRKCGQALGAGAGPGAGSAPSRSPASYTPKHLAEKILTSRTMLEGERKQVTVLFADLKGSMELLADRDPEEARSLLDPVLEHMMEAVHRYEGTVNQVMGDGIMALFGAPVAHEDHAVRACYAALRMQESVKRHAEEMRRTTGVSLAIRVGLNSGEVVVRSIGSDLHMDYTAVGQTTHLAARMEQAALPGSILITVETLRLAEGYVAVASLGAIRVKGLADPVEAYEVTGPGTARTRLQVSLARGLSHFVGRDAEVEQLRRSLEQAAGGHGQLVAVVGEPGVGKSRLFYEFTRSHRTLGWLVLESGSVSYGRATPYLPVIDLLKAYFKVHDGDDHRAIREKLVGKLLTLDRALEPALPVFLSLLDVPVDDSRWQSLDPTQRRHQTLEAVRRLLLRESQLQPLLLIFEDLHWIDSETQALLDELVTSVPTARVLLLVNYRPEYEHGWSGKTYYAQLRVDPLPPEGAEALLHALLGAEPALQPLERLLAQRTEGNPFFVEETIRTLHETGVLTGQPGKLRLAKDVTTIQVPATVQAVLAARIDRLGPGEKQLLQAASVIGKDVPFALLAAIGDLGEEEVHRGLTHLQAAEFVYEKELFPDLEYTFKHALTHEVTYGSLLQARRRALHARVAEAIEAVHVDRFAEHIERLASHCFHGERWAKAAAYFREAGRKAVARSAYEEAASSFEQAFAALGRLEQTREVIAQAVDVLVELRGALFPLADVERMQTAMSRSEALVVHLDDRFRLAVVHSFASNHLFWKAEFSHAVESASRVLAIADEREDPELHLRASFNLGVSHTNLGAYDVAAGFFLRSIAALKEPLFYTTGSAGSMSVLVRSLLGIALAELGRFEEGWSLGEEGLRMAEAVDRPVDVILSAWGPGMLALRRGEYMPAIAPLERSLSLCRMGRFPRYLAWTAGLLGYLRLLHGQPADGAALLEVAVEGAESRRLLLGHSLFSMWLAEARLASGDSTGALSIANRALDLTRQREERGYEAWALHVLGRIASAGGAGDLEAAEARFGDSLTRATELGMRPLVARCRLELGEIHRCARRLGPARDQLTTAVDMFREMGMRFWLEKAETEMRSLA